MDFNHDQLFIFKYAANGFSGLNNDRQFILEEMPHARAEAALEPQSKTGGRDKYPYPPSRGLWISCSPPGAEDLFHCPGSGQ